MNRFAYGFFNDDNNTEVCLLFYRQPQNELAIYLNNIICIRAVHGACVVSPQLSAATAPDALVHRRKYNHIIYNYIYSIVGCKHI